MTQLCMDGFDHYGGDVNNLLSGAWAEILGTGINLSTPSVGARTGNMCLGINVGFVANENIIRRVLGGSFSELFMGFGVFLQELPGVSNEIMPVQLSTAANTAVATVTVRADGALQLRIGDEDDAVVATTTGPVLVAGTWHYLELRMVRNAGAGIFEIRIDNTEVLNATSLNFGGTDIGQVGFGAVNIPTNSSPMYIDDLVVRDSSGTTNNTFMGDLRIATLQPIANGVNQGWTARTISKLGVGVMNFQDPTNRNEAIMYADNAAFEIGSGDFCIEQFVRFDNLLAASATATIASKHRGSTDERSWRLFLNGPDVGATLVFSTSTDGTAGDEVEVHTFPFVPETNRWYHIAVSRTGTDSRMFLDGQQIGITKTDNRAYFDGGARLFINGLQNGSSTALDNNSIDGWMDGVRLTVGAGRYTANFTPPTSALPADIGGDPLYASVALLLNFDSGPAVLDESSNAFSATLYASPSVQFPNDEEAFKTVDGLTPDDNNFVEAALIAATGTLTFLANPLNTETVVIGATTYTFQTVLVDTANNVLIGADAEASLDNLLAAVNLEAGAGTLYGTGTVQNTSAYLTDLPDPQVLATARTAGATGNSVATTTTVTGASWSAATLLGGADIPGNSEFTVSQLPPDVTGIRSVAIIGRNFKTDAGTSDMQMSFVASGGAADAGANRPVSLTPTYYEDTFERDPNTLGALTPSTLLNARIRVNRTL